MAILVDHRHLSSSKVGFGRPNRSRRGSAMAIVAVIALIVFLGCSFGRPLDLQGLIWTDIHHGRLFSRKSEPLNAALDNHNPSAIGSLSTKKDSGHVYSSGLKNLSIKLESCNNNSTIASALLKVFMYDLPPEFHFGMLDQSYSSSRQIWPINISQVPRYPGGLNLQHSIEYWLTLDLLFPSTKPKHMTCYYNVATILVPNPNDADICFVPFFSSLSYNRYHGGGSLDSVNTDKNTELQERLIQFLHRQNAWRNSGGKNHVILMHHPNSLHVAREQLRSAIFVVSDFGRYSSQVANVGKDVVAPYKHMVPTYKDDRSSYHSRATLLYFQGAIVRKEGGMIRQQLYEMLKDEPGVHFSTGNTQNDGIRSASGGMKSSKFCLHLAGDTPSSNRLFDAIASHCVPVVISDEIELPFEDELDYSRFCLFVRSQDALQKGFLMDLLQSVKEEEWTRMWMQLQVVDRHFEFQYPSFPGDAVDMIWQSIAHKVPQVKQILHKEKRYSRSRLPNKKSA